MLTYQASHAKQLKMIRTGYLFTQWLDFLVALLGRKKLPISLIFGSGKEQFRATLN